VAGVVFGKPCPEKTPEKLVPTVASRPEHGFFIQPSSFLKSEAAPVFTGTAMIF